MEKEKIKTKILEEIEKTEAAISRYEKMTTPVTARDSMGRVSTMNAINNKTIAYERLSSVKSKLVNLKKVLAKIDTKSFGLCKKCKKPIAVGRLLIRPESQLCVKCAV